MREFMQKSRTCLAVVILVAFGLVSGALHAAPAQADDVPQEVRKGLEQALQAKVEELANKKDAEGRPYVRGNFSRNFKKIDDGTYQTRFTVDTVDGNRLIVKAFVYTLTRKGDSWEITNEEEKSSFDGMRRGMPGDEKFYRFSDFALEAHGFSVTAKNGTLLVDYFDGVPSSLSVQSDTMTYDYAVPVRPGDEYTERARHKLAIITSDDNMKKDVFFDPEWAAVYCDTPVSCQEILDSAFPGGLSPITADELHPEQKKRYDDQQESLKEAREKRPFWGFRRPIVPERRAFTAVAYKNDDHFGALNYDTHDGFEIVFVSSGFGFRGGSAPLFGYYSEETMKKTDPYELEYREDLGTRDYELVALTGEVELGTRKIGSENMRGDVTFTLKAKRDLGFVDFTITRGRDFRQTEEESKNPTLIVNAVDDGDGNRLTTFSTGPFSGQIILAEPVKAGEEFTLRMDFENRDTIYDYNSSFKGVSRQGWLPFATFADFIDRIDLTVSVPLGYKTLNVGERVSFVEDRENDVSTMRWVTNRPVAFFSIIYGKYEEKTPPQYVAHRYNGESVPIVIHVDRQALTDWDIRPKAMEPLAEHAASSVDLFADIYGVDYPYNGLFLVNDPFGALYGQAPSGLVYLGSAAFRGSGVLEGSTKFRDSLVAHEVAHQWWGSSTANTNQRNYWFVESLAEFSSALWIESVKGSKDYADHIADWRREIMRAGLSEGVQGAATLWAGGFSGYRASVYAKGPYVFHMLRIRSRALQAGLTRQLGHDFRNPDALFYEFLMYMGQRLAGREIVTRDIQRCAEEFYGEAYVALFGEFEEFFDDWIRGMGMPKFEFEYSVRPTEDGQYLVEGTVRQKVVAGEDDHEMDGVFFRGVTRITDQKAERSHWVYIDAKPETTFKKKFAEKPGRITFNEEGDILAHDVVYKEL